MTVRRKAAAQAPPRVIAGTFWLREPLGPAAAWDLLVVLRSGGPAFAPAWFRTNAMAAPRKLGRRSEALAVQCLADAKGVELLRRTGAFPREILHITSGAGGTIIHLGGPSLDSLPDALVFINLVRDLCDVLRPAAGVVDEVDQVNSAPEAREGRPPGYRLGSPPQPMLTAQPQGFFPGWLTILGGDKVIAVGAGRLLMAPVFLIDPLLDGGLLIAATPLPRKGGARAGRRSPARVPDLRPQGGRTGAPLHDPGEAPVLT